jgi:hypothetical protein
VLRPQPNPFSVASVSSYNGELFQYSTKCFN